MCLPTASSQRLPITLCVSQLFLHIAHIPPPPLLHFPRLATPPRLVSTPVLYYLHLHIRPHRSLSLPLRVHPNLSHPTASSLPIDLRSRSSFFAHIHSFQLLHCSLLRASAGGRSIIGRPPVYLVRLRLACVLIMFTLSPKI